MTRRWPLLVVPCLLAVAVAGVVLSQPWRRSYPGDGIRFDRRGVPDWENEPRFRHDVFTFVRVEYDSYGRWGRRGRRGGGWATDYPDSDLNLSFRLQQLTTLKVNPEPIVLRLTDERIFDHPFLYMIEPGSLVFSEDEVKALRHYLLNGGFLMVDDFWGDYQWENFEREIKRVFPDRPIEELPIDHEIFRCVYHLQEKPQVPSINSAFYGQERGITWETGHGPGAEEVHFRAIFDDKGRMMTIICHNTDLGDGWEREGEDPWYFREYAEKKSYPMGINIIFYAMTH